MTQIVGSSLLGLVLILGVLIFVHEAGHFLTAKLFGVRVLVFSLGFGKRLFGFRRGGTDYRVSLVPLGGYVRMAGDVPEENQPSNPDEFLSKPKWQRFLILLAGPAMNIVTAIVLVTIINMTPTRIFPIGSRVGTVTPNSPAAKAGLVTGDKILRIGNDRIEDFQDLRLAIGANAGAPLHVEYERDGVRRETTLTPVVQQDEYGPVGRAGITPWVDPVVGSVTAGSPAALAGVRPGDRIIAAEGKPVRHLMEFDPVLDAGKNKPVRIEVQRGNQRLPLTLAADSAKPSEGYRGILPPSEIRKFALGPAIRESIAQNQKMAKMIFAGLGKLVRGRSKMDDWAGPVSIARISGAALRASLIDFLGLMALVSVNLGILNLMPVPVLDGGHIFIILVEAAARRDLSIATKERVQQIGFAVIAVLMIAILYNDIIRSIFGPAKG